MAKRRTGFVSNSSSSSFVLSKYFLSDEQQDNLLNMDGKRIGDYQDEWYIIDAGPNITGHTYMDNGCKESGLWAWMSANGYPMNQLQWEWN